MEKYKYTLLNKNQFQKKQKLIKTLFVVVMLIAFVIYLNFFPNSKIEQFSRSIKNFADLSKTSIISISTTTGTTMLTKYINKLATYNNYNNLNPNTTISLDIDTLSTKELSSMPTTISMQTTPSTNLTNEITIDVFESKSTTFNNSTIIPFVSETTEPKILRVSKSIKPVRYYVKSEQCQIPWVNPFSAPVLEIFVPEKYEPCSNDEPLVSSYYDADLQRYILHVNSTLEQNISCCYRDIVRSGVDDDDSFDLLPCANFHQNFTVPDHIDGMIINCKSIETNETVQEDAFSFIQHRHSKKRIINKKENPKKPSVILIGIDSLSRFNFRRNMPRTAEYLEQNKWFELEGYNKVGDNTFPNLVPFFTGMNETQAHSVCKPKRVGWDKCDFIWKHYKKHGYWTAYAEDTTFMSSFNYCLQGFYKPPTDYYLRPLMMAVESRMKIVDRFGLSFCCGRRQSGEYVYDFGLEFANRFRDQPAFGFFWTNSFSHNGYGTSSSMDVKMREYMEKFEHDGIFDDAIVVFFSDHGCRWGELLDLPDGFLEERLPMFFMSLPKWFRESYPDLVRALEINKNRLTTPFDIHQTLKHILALGDPTAKKELTPATSCAAAQSIFYEIPEQRSCGDACIPEHWCTCVPYEIISRSDPVVETVGDLIVDGINNYLSANNFSSICRTLKMKSIEEAQLKIEEASKVTTEETVRIKFFTTPKDASFQATAVYDLEKHNITVVIENISRLDIYANHSACIDNKLAKKFCICNH